MEIGRPERLICIRNTGVISQNGQSTTRGSINAKSNLSVTNDENHMHCLWHFRIYVLDVYFRLYASSIEMAKRYADLYDISINQKQIPFIINPSQIIY